MNVNRRVFIFHYALFLGKKDSQASHYPCTKLYLELFKGYSCFNAQNLALSTSFVTKLDDCHNL